MGPSQQPAQLRDLMPLESRALGQKGRACARKLLPELGNRLCFLFLAHGVLSRSYAASFLLSAVVSTETPGPIVDDSVTDLRRSEEHTSELQSLRHLVCRLLLEKKKHALSAGARAATAV